jgi:hypothetical protein
MVTHGDKAICGGQRGTVKVISAQVSANLTNIFAV